ncbi:MAG: HEAT repeat domain-containing protein [Gammaproteobacteria bacterium]
MTLPFESRRLATTAVFCTGAALGLLARPLLPPQGETARPVSADRGSQCVAVSPGAGNGQGSPVALVAHDRAEPAREVAPESLAEGAEPLDTVDGNALAPTNADSIDSEDAAEMPRTELVRLIDDYLSREDPMSDAVRIAEQLTPLLEGDFSLLDELFDREWPQREYLHELLTDVGLFAGEALKTKVRDTALDLTDSARLSDRNDGLTLLAHMDSASDPLVRRRLLDVGWTERAPEAQLAVAQGLSPTLVPPAEREEIVALLSEMAQSNADARVRASAIYQLAAWEPDSDAFVRTSVEVLNDSDPWVRAAGIDALAELSLSSGQRARLFELAENPAEPSFVRMSAANALIRLQLSEHEYQVVASVLSAEEE